MDLQNVECLLCSIIAPITVIGIRLKVELRNVCCRENYDRRSSVLFTTPRAQLLFLLTTDLVDVQSPI